MSKSNANNIKHNGYHCDYCRCELNPPPPELGLYAKHPLTWIRLRCAECHDYDLCLVCYSEGRYTAPHLPTHNYLIKRPFVEYIFEVGWQADEELLLLEAIELYGFGNWSDCATYVGTKSARKCEQHYERIYMSSQYAPLPDLHIPPIERVPYNDDSDDEERPTKSRKALKGMKNSKSVKNSLNTVQQLQRHNSNSSITSNLTNTDNNKQKWLPSVLKPKSGIASIVGYVPNRFDYDNEYNNDAETYICELEFNDTDTELEIKRKLALIDIYNNVLDARIERKVLIQKHNLFEQFDKPVKRTPHEQMIYDQFKLYMRFMSTQHHNTLLQCLAREQHLITQIKQYQEYRINGVKYLVDVPYYEQLRAKRAKLQSTYQSTMYHSTNHYNNNNGMLSIDNDTLPPLPNDILSNGKSNNNNKNEYAELDKQRPSFDLSVMPGNELLSTAEFELCLECHLIPKHYFLLKHTILRIYCSKSYVTFKLVRQAIPRVDGKLLTKIYEFVNKQGWINSTEQTAAQALINEKVIHGDIQMYHNIVQQQSQINNDTVHTANIVKHETNVNHTQPPIVATVLQQ